MTCLILVKHAMPEIDTALPPPRWLLGEAGRAGARLLADDLAPYAPSVIVTSNEPKAAETGAIVGERFGVPVSQRPDLHEHVRDALPFLGTEDFHARISEVFARPDERVVGQESATEALARFSRAVHETLAAYAGTVVIATHGTVLSLFVAACTGVDGFDLWTRLDLPSYVVLARPELGLVSIVESIGAS